MSVSNLCPAFPPFEGFFSTHGGGSLKDMQVTVYPHPEGIGWAVATFHFNAGGSYTQMTIPADVAKRWAEQINEQLARHGYLEAVTP